MLSRGCSAKSASLHPHDFPRKSAPIRTIGSIPTDRLLKRPVIAKYNLGRPKKVPPTILLSVYVENETVAHLRASGGAW